MFKVLGRTFDSNHVLSIRLTPSAILKGLYLLAVVLNKDGDCNLD